MPEYVKEAPLRLEVGLIEYRLQTDSRGNSPPLSHETESASTENVGSASSSAPKTVMSMTPARKRTRSEVESLPFAPPKKVAKKTSMAMNKHSIPTRKTMHDEEWYSATNTARKYGRRDLITIKYINQLTINCTKAAKTGEDMTKSFDAVSQELQQLPFLDCLSGVLLNDSGLLGPNGTLTNIFKNTVNGVFFPWHIRADAEMLYRKWQSGKIDPHLLWGITTKVGKKGGRNFRVHSFDRDIGDRKISCNYSGDGQLVNGQWFPFQICANRDGCHGEIEAGIHGQPDGVAYSVVVSGGGYTNIDNGEVLQYCGTSGKENAPTRSTKQMIQAMEKRTAIRVLRSSTLPASNIYRPAKGLRYDGLYVIDDVELLDPGTSMYRFKLVRLEGQRPIRYQGKEIRPSVSELHELAKVHHMFAKEE